MTLEQINDVEDKAERLRLLNDYIARVIQETHDADEIAADEQMNASRDEAHGMMSRFGGRRKARSITKRCCRKRCRRKSWRHLSIT